MLRTKTHTHSSPDLGSAAKPIIGTRQFHAPDEIWYCKEFWYGDSRDGQYLNGDGYHYFEMQGDGHILRAFEFYETDEGEERCLEMPDLVGVNWFSLFGFEDDEVLENITTHEFSYVQSLTESK